MFTSDGGDDPDTRERSSAFGAPDRGAKSLELDDAEASDRNTGGADSSNLQSGASALASNLLDTTCDNQAVTYRNVLHLPLATRTIHRGTEVPKPLSRSEKTLEGLHYTYEGSERSLDRWVDESRIAGLLVLKEGAIAHEVYAMGNEETTRWSNFSMAKSFTSTLVGAALNDGYIDTLDDPVSTYVPELSEGAYSGTTIRQCLQMVSGVEWGEDNYTEAIDSDIAQYSKIMYSARPGALMELIRTRPRAAAPGSVFRYSTADSYVLGAVVAAATGKTLSDYLSEKIWRRLGMEADAYWILDSPNGLELGGNGISATLRDFGRFGHFILGGGEEVLPRGWRDEAGSPHLPITDYGHPYLTSTYAEEPLGFGYHWKAVPPGLAGAAGDVPTFMAIGLGGQYIYVNPAENVVVVLLSCWRDEQLPAVVHEYYAVLEAVVEALH